MSDSPQNVYARNLQQLFGYPLRFPEPNPGLPSSYKEQGLHIGDVGYVDEVGMFEVLFNICFSSDHELHFRRKDLASLVGLTKFTTAEAPPIPNAFPPGRVICHGIQGSHSEIPSLKDSDSTPCKFTSCATSGAILVLSSGAVRHSLNKDKEDEFRKLAEKHALSWCRVTASNSLYLITGLYKTSSWHLASFHDTKPVGQVLIERNGSGRYNWHSSCDYRQSPKGNRSENQTVLVAGFKIEVRGWDQHTVVEKLAPQSTSIWSELNSMVDFFLGILIFLWRIASRIGVKNLDHGAHVERVPALSQPFHPSDAINRFILDKNTNVQVAVTHDSQWLSMLEKNELSPEDMAQEGRFRAFLEENYTCDSDAADNIIYLKRKNNEPNDLHTKDLCAPKVSLRARTLPTALDDSRQTVITCMRFENVVAGLKRTPVGFFALVQFKGTKRRTKIKSVLLHDNVIEWDEEIVLPKNLSVKVRISVNASFEFEPMLGFGEPLCVSEVSVGNLSQAGSTYFHSSSENGQDVASHPSFLITLEERRVDYLTDWNIVDDNLECGDSTSVAEVTDQAHASLFRYHKTHQNEDLLRSLECFENALQICPPEHDCRAAALFNLATARFVNCQVYGIIPDIDTAISLYRDSLALRPTPSLNRPITLLYLAHALLYRYRALGGGDSLAHKIEELVTEVKDMCWEGSYEYRAADLVQQTLRRFKVITVDKVDEVDQLLSELERSARLPPDFDRPQRLVNLSAVQYRRFEITGGLDDLDQSILTLQEAVQLTPVGHVDNPRMLTALGEAFRSRAIIRDDPVDLDKAISLIDKAVQLTPHSHFDKPWVLSCLGHAFRARFEMHIAKSDAGRYPARRSDLNDSPHTGSTPPSTRIQCSDNLDDLERAMTKYKEAIELSADDHPDKVNRLNDLAATLIIRFKQLGNLKDLEQALLRNKNALELLPEDRRASILRNLVTFLLHE